LLPTYQAHEAAMQLTLATQTNKCRLWCDDNLLAPDYIAKALKIVAHVEKDGRDWPRGEQHALGMAAAAGFLPLGARRCRSQSAAAASCEMAPRAGPETRLVRHIHRDRAALHRSQDRKSEGSGEPEQARRGHAPLAPEQRQKLSG